MAERLPFPENHRPDDVRPRFCAECGLDFPCDVADMASDLAEARERIAELERQIDVAIDQRDRWTDNAQRHAQNAGFWKKERDALASAAAPEGEGRE
jgi:hypothetical protein